MTTLIIAITMAFNFSSVEIVNNGTTLETVSKSGHYTVCQFDLSSDNLMNDIAETEGECFSGSIVSIF